MAKVMKEPVVINKANKADEIRKRLLTWKEGEHMLLDKRAVLMYRAKEAQLKINGDWKPDWKPDWNPRDGIRHWTPYYDQFGGKMVSTYHAYAVPGAFYFKTKEDCELFIEVMGDELLKIIGVEKGRCQNNMGLA